MKPSLQVPYQEIRTHDLMVGLSFLQLEFVFTIFPQIVFEWKVSG